MRDVKIGVMEAWTQLKLMLFRSKTLVALLALTSLLISYLQPLADVAAEINQEINPVEPFLLLINSGGSFPSPFVYIYIFFPGLINSEKRMLRKASLGLCFYVLLFVFLFLSCLF